jgi:hypothetical protein
MQVESSRPKGKHKLSIDTSGPGSLPEKASLGPLNHRYPPGPFLRIGRQSRLSLAIASP